MHDSIKKEMVEAMESVMSKNRFILDTEVALFEQEYAHYSGVQYGVGVASGLDALHMSLKFLDVGRGDEVIVPAHTCPATWLAVAQTHASIVPVDVDSTSMLIDPLLVEQAITSKTKAIVPVHLYGHLCDMDSLVRIAKENDLKIVEDNAQAHGASFQGKKSGSFGHCNGTSFYPTKNLGAFGDGGMITTDDETIYQKALVFRNYGLSPQGVSQGQGINSRLDELQAAVLRVKLPYLDEWNQTRKRIATMYLTYLSEEEEIMLPSPPDASHVCHLFVIRTCFRDALKIFLEKKNIKTSIHYPVPFYHHRLYNHCEYREGDFPVSDSIANTILSLPSWPGLEEESICYVSDAIKEFFQQKKLS